MAPQKTLAYHDAVTITGVTGFIVQARGLLLARATTLSTMTQNRTTLSKTVKKFR
jgi:hypothetical protein